MGRPFILYSEPEEGGSVGTRPPEREWFDGVLKALETSGFAIDHDIHQILDWLYSQKQVAYLPRVEPHVNLDILGTKVGGVPYLQPDEDWPFHESMPLSFFWQFRIEELPHAVQEALGSDEGLFQVFIDSELPLDDEKDAFLFRIIKKDELLPRDVTTIEVPESATTFEEQQVVSYEAKDDWPHWEDLMDSVPERLDKDMLEKVLTTITDAGLISTQAGDKFIGWPNWCQGAEWCTTVSGERYKHVMQLEGTIVEFMVGDAGTLLMQRHPDDNNDWNVSWACC